MRIIFLDFDGVLNNLVSRQHRPPSTNIENPDEIWDTNCVECLNAILRATGAKIVVSSNWRHDHSPGELFTMLKGMGVDYDQHIAVTPTWKTSGRNILNAYGSRAEEIRAFLSANRHVSNFVILDDGYGQGYEIETDPVLCDHFVNTSDDYGLLPYHVDRAIEILNDEYQ